ncbi:hypothetical protein DMI69_14715 [Escherichia coli]|nr:hypothetical protein [Escherichia coli]
MITVSPALIRHTRGNEILFIPALFILFSLGGAIFGMGEEAVAFAIIIAPLMVRLGYDSITTVLVTILPRKSVLPVRG